jgi:predicted transcriptional regulator
VDDRHARPTGASSRDIRPCSHEVAVSDGKDVNETHVLVGELVEPVIRVGATVLLVDIAKLLAETGCERVVVSTEPPTELSEADIVRCVAQGLGPDASAADVAGHTVLVVDRSTPVNVALELMIAHNRRSVIVVDEQGTALGIVRIGSALAALLQGPSWLGALRIALRIDEVVP